MLIIIHDMVDLQPKSTIEIPDPLLALLHHQKSCVLTNATLMKRLDVRAVQVRLRREANGEEAVMYLYFADCSEIEHFPTSLLDGQVKWLANLRYRHTLNAALDGTSQGQQFIVEFEQLPEIARQLVQEAAALREAGEATEVSPEVQEILRNIKEGKNGLH
jgi:hypothetical protein